MLRKEALEQRASLSVQEVKSKSIEITKRLMSLKEYRESNLIMCYMDFRNEVATGMLIDESMVLGKRIAVPFILQTADIGKEMFASELSDRHNGLVKGTFGILEPKKEKVCAVEPDTIDLVIVPGVAFDIFRSRLGYGAGFYDRFLKKVKPDCRKIAIAFETQIKEFIPVGEKDVPMDMVITEDRII